MFKRFSSVQFSRSDVSDSLWPHGLQHSRPPSPSPAAGVYSNSCPLSRWCHPTISSSVVPFSSHLQSFPASESFQMSQFFTSGGQSIVVSALASVIEYSGLISFRMDWLDLLTVQGTLKSLLQVRGIKCIFDLMIFSTNNGFIRLKPHWKLRKICTRIHKLKGFLKGRSLSSLGTVVEEKYITTFPLVPWLCI